MKKLFERLTADTPIDLPPMSELAASTRPMPLDGADDLPDAQPVPWRARALQVRAEPFAPADGWPMFAAIWHAESHAVELSPQDVQTMTAYLQFVRIPAAQTVIGQDERGDFMLMILDGAMAVDRVQPWGGRARINEARRGDMVGEMALLDSGARFSACTTITPCTAAVLDGAHFATMMHLDPRLALALSMMMSRRLSLRLRQVSARLSALLSRS
jgi:CRP-like cAMP-binding protein